MSTQLVNGIYPVEYFQLANVDPILEADDSFWASAERFATVNPAEPNRHYAEDAGGVPTAEYKEIDLGRVRQINGLVLDIVKMPVDIVIEYDAVSADDGTHVWLPVKQLSDQTRFDDKVFYEAQAKSSWQNCQFFFTDENGQMIHSRYLRVTYHRRNEAWPTRNNAPFPWSIMVKNLRTFRYVADHPDTIGPLFEVDIDAQTARLDLPVLMANTTREIVQQFVYPENAARGDIMPALLGFSFLAFVDDGPYVDVDQDDRARWRWELWNVTDPLRPEQVEVGVVNGTKHVGRVWIDCYFKAPLDGTPSDVFEVRVSSLVSDASRSVFVHSPNNIPGTRLPGTLAFVNNNASVTFTPNSAVPLTQVLGVGDFIQEIGGRKPYRVNAVSDTSITLDETWKGATATKPAIKVRPLRRAPGRITSPLIGSGSFTNNSTSVTWTPQVGFDLTTYLAPNDYIQLIAGGPVMKVTAVTTTSITLDLPYMGDTADDMGVSRVQQLDGDKNPINDALVNDPERSLVMRLWADVGDTGRDVLGNAYRHGTRRDRGEFVLDPAKAGWMSAPRPSADAVEALYFDVRGAMGTGQRTLSVIDVLKIAPRTPGVRMHVYFTTDALQGRTPETDAEWDHMMWSPVNETYVLRKENLIELPQSIKASYVKLEFSNLRPMPFNTATFPELPPVEYRRYPTWVEDAFKNSTLRRAVEDWFIQNAEPVQRRILAEISDPIREFEFETRAYLTALAQGTFNDVRSVNAGLVDQGSQVFIDPVTSSKIYLGSNTQYRGNLIASVREDSLLGRSILATSASPPLAVERIPDTIRKSPYVSTKANRVAHSFSTIAETPMWFNRRCRHMYRVERARFDRQAYYVGIKTVEFQRNDYTVRADTVVIDDILHDDQHVELRTFTQDISTSIPDANELVAAGSSPINAYVSYRVGDVIVVDEPVALYDFTLTDLLQVGAPATNIEVWSAPGKQGLQYNFGTDFVTTYATEQDGDTLNQIGRSDLSNKLIVDHDTTGGNSYQDASTAVGVARAAVAPFNLDAGTVDGRAIISGIDFMGKEDVASITGVASISAAEGREYGTYPNVVIGVAVPSSVNTLESVGDDDTPIVGQAIVSGTEDRLRIDAGTVTGIAGIGVVIEEGGTVTGQAVIPVYSPTGGSMGDGGFGGGSFGDLDSLYTEVLEHIERGKGVPVGTGGMDFWLGGEPLPAFDTVGNTYYSEGERHWVGGQPIAPFSSTRDNPKGTAVVTAVEVYP